MMDRYIIALVYGGAWLTLGWSCYLLVWRRDRKKKRRANRLERFELVGSLGELVVDNCSAEAYPQFERWASKERVRVIVERLEPSAASSSTPRSSGR